MIENIATDNPNNALKELRQGFAYGNPFQVILLDEELPSLEGLEFARLIQADGKIEATEIIMLCSKVDEDKIAAFESVGIKGYVTKPVKHAFLAEKIKQVLEKKEKIAHIGIERQTQDQRIGTAGSPP